MNRHVPRWRGDREQSSQTLGLLLGGGGRNREDY